MAVSYSFHFAQVDLPPDALHVPLVDHYSRGGSTVDQEVDRRPGSARQAATFYQRTLLSDYPPLVSCGVLRDG
jgi:hypothetical protein